MKAAFFLHVFVTCYMFGSPEFLTTEPIDDLKNDRRRLLTTNDIHGNSDVSMIQEIWSRMIQTHVFPVFSIGALSFTFTVVPFFIPFLSPEKLHKAFKLLKSAAPPQKYYAPGYNSTFHSLLTNAQRKHVDLHGDLSASDKEKGYKLNKNKKVSLAAEYLSFANAYIYIFTDKPPFVLVAFIFR